MATEDDALEHARRLAAAPVLRGHGPSQQATELYSDEGRVPEHVGLRTTVGRQGQALALTIEVTARGREWQVWAERALALLAIGTGASFGLAVLSLTVLVLWWG
jgi:hypothetical protein